MAKNWTYEDLYTLWRERGYSKKDAKAKAEIELREQNRAKSGQELYQIELDMYYN